MTAASTQAVACVTGASGLVGARIVVQLLARGFTVRVLSRAWRHQLSDVRVFEGDLLNEGLVARFLDGADVVFHAAAELTDRSMMWRTNVQGTETLLRCAERSRVAQFCNISSVGVIGPVGVAVADECTPCAPATEYERSKWAAEQVVTRASGISRVVSLRPTNIVARERPGALAIAMRASLRDRMKTFVQGRECVHLIHAENVAAAAMQMLSLPAGPPEVYIVSADHEPMNTLAGLWTLAQSVGRGLPPVERPTVYALPRVVPSLLRRVLRSRSRGGPVRYSSAKLFSTGFVFPYGLETTVRDVVARGSACHPWVPR